LDKDGPLLHFFLNLYRKSCCIRCRRKNCNGEQWIRNPKTVHN